MWKTMWLKLWVFWGKFFVHKFGGKLEKLYKELSTDFF